MEFYDIVKYLKYLMWSLIFCICDRYSREYRGFCDSVGCYEGKS